MWKFNERTQNWEYNLVESEAGEVVIKQSKPQEVVLINEPEGQVVLKKARKGRKKNIN